MTARDEVLAAARAIAGRGQERFTVAQIHEELTARDVSLPTPVVETLVTSAMCLFGEGSSRVRYDDFIKVGEDRYRIASSAGGDPITGPPRELTSDEIQRGRFTLAVVEAVRLVPLLTDHDPVVIKAELLENGALPTVKRALAQDEVSDGFDALRDQRRLDLSVEWLALTFHDLFTQEERRVAYDRLAGRDVPIDDWLTARLGRFYP